MSKGKAWVNAASQQTLIVSGSPSNSMLGGGDLNAIPDHRYEWVIVVLGVNAASQQTLLLSLAPHLIQCQGEVT